MHDFSLMSSEVKRKSWQAARARLLRTTWLFCDCLFFVCWSWHTGRAALEAADGTDDDRGPMSSVCVCLCVCVCVCVCDREGRRDRKGE